MSGNNGKPDPIAAAIAATEQPEQIPVVMQQIPVTIASTGRPAVIAIPADASDGEIAEVAGWMLTSVMAAFRAKRAQPVSRIVVPGGVRIPS